MVPIKDRIINAFVQLAPKRGIYRMSMDELAAEAGISKRTVYRYFRSKDEIIEVALETLLQKITTYVNKTIEEAETSEEALRVVLKTGLNAAQNYITFLVMEDMRTHYPHIWKKIDEFRIRNAVMIVDKLYGKGGQKEFRDINPLIIAEVVKASIQAVLTPDFILRNNLTSEETLKQLLFIFKNGFLN